MRPDFRMLPLLPSLDQAGRRVARLGRALQPQWFEAILLDASDMGCISREAVELSWGGPPQPSAALTLRVLGSGVVLVEDAVVARGDAVPLRPGSRITFAFQAPSGEISAIVALAVHCAAQQAAVTVPPLPAPGAASPRPPEAQPHALPSTAAPQGSAPWRLECVHVAGLTPEAFWSLPAAACQLSVGAPATTLGRQHEAFEALLKHEPGLLQLVSRSHFRLEPREDGCMLVTNLSQNVAVVAGRALHPDESAEVAGGDTLSFAQTHAEEGVEEGPNAPVVPFLTLRLVAPPPPELQEPSSYVMLDPPSLAAVSPPSPEGLPEANEFVPGAGAGPLSTPGDSKLDHRAAEFVPGRAWAGPAAASQQATSQDGQTAAPEGGGAQEDPTVAHAENLEQSACTGPDGVPSAVPTTAPVLHASRREAKGIPVDVQVVKAAATQPLPAPRPKAKVQAKAKASSTGSCTSM